MSLQSSFAEIAASDGRAALVTVIEPRADSIVTGARLLVRPDDGPVGSLGSQHLDREGLEVAEELIWRERCGAADLAAARVFVDVAAPPPRLLIFGAIDFAAPLSRAARMLGWRPIIIDPRSRFARPERFPDATEVIADWPDKAVPQIGGIDRATYIAVLTHDPKLDDAALEVALTSDAPYIGAMGSRRAQAERHERLLSSGMHREALDRIAAPIGLDIGAVSPGETAVSILGEMIALRNGRPGGPLSASAGRIHAVPA